VSVVEPASHRHQPAELTPWEPGAFLEALRAQAPRYHDRHPFHAAMNEGRLQRAQIQGWVANRFYYQKIIPIKDATILSKCPFPAVRRRWIKRIVDHDGKVEGEGGIETWLRLAEAVGLTRAEVLDERHVVPSVRFAADAYVMFTRTRPWIESVASSLTELFAPDLMAQRLAAFERYYTWVDSAGLDYFRSRLPLARQDSQEAVELVLQYCTTRELQERAVAALRFKCDVLWALIDGIHHAYVEPA
jgi:pyrroloquinoline-quinone synthase